MLMAKLRTSSFQPAYTNSERCRNRFSSPLAPGEQPRAATLFRGLSLSDGILNCPKIKRSPSREVPVSQMKSGDRGGLLMVRTLYKPWLTSGGPVSVPSRPPQKPSHSTHSELVGLTKREGQELIQETQPLSE
ncbi:hypothetical protein RRG08_054307 [Elysia crispata]|uniref:Uncharacterized protein n=1 Tax=Elysia crispata TaxID=231223 RepID=A0AAE1AQ39_9GAST|nr:hypothetical protein RRG08_054307 [Elysia crispata]